MVIETFLTVQNVQNGHVYIDVVKQHIPQNAYFQRKSPITDFQPIALHQSRFWPFSRKPSDLEFMLLHNSYINVAIAVILLGRKSLYDLQKLR